MFGMIVARARRRTESTVRIGTSRIWDASGRDLWTEDLGARDQGPVYCCVGLGVHSTEVARMYARRTETWFLRNRVCDYAAICTIVPESNGGDAYPVCMRHILSKGTFSRDPVSHLFNLIHWVGESIGSVGLLVLGFSDGKKTHLAFTSRYKDTLISNVILPVQQMNILVALLRLSTHKRDMHTCGSRVDLYRPISSLASSAICATNVTLLRVPVLS